MAGTEDVRSYVKVVNGKAVTVRPYSRTNNDVATAAQKLPGRPMLSAQPGAFPGGRAIPNIWPQDLQQAVEDNTEDIPEEDKVLPPAKSLREASQRIMDELKHYADTPAAQKVRQLLSEVNYDDFHLSAGDEEVLELAVRFSKNKGVVAVRNYTRVVNGKVIHVRAYTQIRDLLSKFGGPTMAAKKGITQNLLVDAMKMENRLPKGEMSSAVKRVKGAVKDTKRVSAKTRETVNKAKSPQPTTPKSKAAPKTDVPDTKQIKKPTVEDDAPKEAKTPKSTAKVETPKPKPAPQKRSYTHPSGSSFDLQDGETLKRSKSNPDRVAVFDSAGTMKYQISPDGKRQKGFEDTAASLWEPYEDRSSIKDFDTTPATKSSNPDIPEDAPKDTRKLFTHPKGAEFILHPGDKILRHKTTRDAYMVEDRDGNFKYRITPSGKAYTSSTKREYYEELPEPLKESKASESEQEGSREATDAPSESTVRPLETFRDDKSEAWNRGAMAYRNSQPSTPTADPWISSQVGEVGDTSTQATMRDFTAGYDYAADQEYWWGQQNKGEDIPGGIELEEAFRPENVSPDAEFDRVGQQSPTEPTIYDEDKPVSWNQGVELFQKGMDIAGALDQVRKGLDDSDPATERKIDSAVEGYFYAAKQKDTFDQWVKGIDPPKNFMFDRTLYPDAKDKLEEERIKKIFAGPDLTDNESWRKSDAPNENKWFRLGYEQFRPGYNQKVQPWAISDFADQITSNSDATNSTRERQIRAGFEEAQFEWERASGVASDASEDYNKGKNYFEGVNRPAPPSASEEFSKGYREALQIAAMDRLIEANLPVTEDSIKEQEQLIEAARKDGRTLSPLEAEAKTLMPEDVAQWDEAERVWMLQNSKKFISDVVDRNGFTWTQDPSGNWTSPSAPNEKLRLERLIDQRLAPPKPLTLDDLIGDEKRPDLPYKISSLPIGSTIEAPNGVSISVDDVGIKINGNLIPDNLVYPALNSLVDRGVVHHKLTERGSNPSKNRQEVEATNQALNTSLEGLPESIQRLIANNTHIKSSEGKDYVDLKPSVLAYVSHGTEGTMPSLELPEQNLDFNPEGETGVLYGLKVNTWDLQSRYFPEGVKVASIVTGNKNGFTTTVTHETAHAMEGILTQALTPSEKHDFYKDLARAVIDTLPENRRADFKRFTRPTPTSQYTNRRLDANELNYPLTMALEYAMMVQNDAIPSQLSTYATTNAAELIAESWADYRLNPNASPLAKKIGNTLQKAVQVAGERIDAAARGELTDNKYIRETIDSLVTAPSALQMVAQGKVLDRDAVEALHAFLTKAVGKPIDLRLNRNGGMVVHWDEGKAEFNFPAKHGMSVSLEGDDEAGLDLHDSMLKLAKDSGVRTVLTNVGGSKAALMGYDFHPKYRDTTLAAILNEADNHPIPAKYQSRWDNIRDLVESGDTTSITPAELYMVGQFEDGNVLDKIDGWVGYIGLDNFFRDEMTTPPKNLPRDNSIISKHGVELADPKSSTDADRLYQQATKVFSTMDDAKVEWLAQLDPQDRRSPSEQAASRVVEAFFGVSPSEKSIFAAYAFEDAADIPSRPNTPPQLPQYDKWLEKNPESKDVIDSVAENFGKINDSIRYKKEDTEAEVLDEAFKTAPKLTAPVQIHIPTTRSTVLPEGSVIKDQGYLRGALQPDDDEDGPRVVLNLEPGQQVLWDGWNYILPRNTQITIVNSDEGSNLMRAEIRREPLLGDDFVTPPRDRFQPPTGPRPDITPEMLRHMSVHDIAELFFGVGIPIHIFRWILNLLDVAFIFAFVT